MRMTMTDWMKWKEIIVDGVHSWGLHLFLLFSYSKCWIELTFLLLPQTHRRLYTHKKIYISRQINGMIKKSHKKNQQQWKEKNKERKKNTSEPNFYILSLHVFMLDLLPVHGKNKNLKFKVHLHNIKMWDIFFHSFLLCSSSACVSHVLKNIVCVQYILADIFQG